MRKKKVRRQLLRLQKQKKMFNKSAILFLIIALIFFASCNTTKLVPKDDALYTGATIKVKDSTLSKNKKIKSLIKLNICQDQNRTVNFSEFLLN